MDDRLKIKYKHLFKAIFSLYNNNKKKGLLMAVVIIADVGGTNSNSYVTLLEATEYFSTRLHVDKWDNASDDDKSKALIMATKRIDQENFHGDRQTTTQALKFARINLGYLDGIDLNGIIPPQIKEATYETALLNLSVDMGKQDVNTGAMKSVKVGSISVDYVQNDNTNVQNAYDFTPLIESLLSDLSVSISSSGWMEVSR